MRWRHYTGEPGRDSWQNEAEDALRKLAQKQQAQIVELEDTVRELRREAKERDAARFGKRKAS